jgi:cysteine desulfurase
VRRDRGRIAIEPLLYGGGHERRLRSGTLPVPLIVGFGAACRIASEEMREEAARLTRLRERLQAGLQREIDGLSFNGHPTERLPGNLNVSFEGVDGEALMAGLTGLAVSSGSACTSADPEPSHVLRAMGLSEALTRASLRFGLGRTTTESEIDEAAQIVAEVVSRLRKSAAVTCHPKRG